MNVETFQRAQVAAFCYDQARRTGSLNAMLAIAYVLRNRVKAGWWGGSWLGVLNAAGQSAGNVTETAGSTLDPQDMLLQRLLREIDNVVAGEVTELSDMVDDALYYAFVDRRVTKWFQTHIARQHLEHPHIATAHPVMLYR